MGTRPPRFGVLLRARAVGDAIRAGGGAVCVRRGPGAGNDLWGEGGVGLWRTIRAGFSVCAPSGGSRVLPRMRRGTPYDEDGTRHARGRGHASRLQAPASSVCTAPVYIIGLLI